tara:strand:- start:118 stop:531 length:414 start_codon:yes stop_codon:yes gene_type:complete
MHDEEFLSQFEALTFPVADFRHRDHVRLAWIYLSRCDPLEGLGRFAKSLKAFANHHGATGKYHETITWAFFLLINERIRRADPGLLWEEFEAGNPDLFNWEENVLRRYYTEEALASELAKATFVLPDRVPAQVGGVD